MTLGKALFVELNQNFQAKPSPHIKESSPVVLNKSYNKLVYVLPVIHTFIWKDINCEKAGRYDIQTDSWLQ